MQRYGKSDYGKHLKSVAEGRVFPAEEENSVRTLITGAHGQLGNELKRLLESGQAEIGPISSAYKDAEVDYIDIDELDISDHEAVDAWFVAHDPYDLVINGAAMTNVDGCEKHFDQAFAANALGPMNLPLCSRTGSSLFMFQRTMYFRYRSAAAY